MMDSKRVLLVVGATVATTYIASIVIKAARKKKRDILQSLLEDTAPVAAAKELSHAGKSTCECLFGGHPMIITADARVADYIFNGRAKDNYVRRPAEDNGLQCLGMYERGLIWNNELPVWKKIRTCFRMALNDAALRRAVAVAKEECNALLQDSTNGEKGAALNLLDMSRRVTFRTTLRVFFGIHSNEFVSAGIEEETFIEAIVAYFKAWEYLLLRPVTYWEASMVNGHKDAVTELNQHVQTLLGATLTMSTKDSTNGNLFIERLRTACQTEEDSGALLQQSALEMMLAGTDTSSVTAYYALLGIAGDPDLQQELRRELLSDDSSILLNSVINETLRFKPVGPVVLREAVHNDAKFPGSLVIESGTAVLVHLAAMNLRDEYWNDPCTFHPKRFMNGDSNCTDQKVFFPFGDGPKGCIGMHLGRREVSAIVETVVSHYEMTIEGDVTLESLQTHWDIANQPDKPPLILVSRQT